MSESIREHEASNILRNLDAVICGEAIDIAGSQQGVLKVIAWKSQWSRCGGGQQSP